MNLQDYLFWAPDDYLNIYRAYGIRVYDLATYIAVLGGSAFFWWFLSLNKIGTVKKTEALIAVIVCAVVFSRLFHIVFWDLHQYILRPHYIFRTGPGRSIHGVVFGFAAAAFIVAKFLNMQIAKITDALSLWAMWGLLFARIGNFYNSESIGTPSTLPWAVRFYFSADHGGIPRHPVQLYEALFTLVLLAASAHIFFRWKKRKPGLVTALILIGFSSGRFVFDYVKHGPGFLFGGFLSTGQILSIPFFLSGVWLLWYLYSKDEQKV